MISLSETIAEQRFDEALSQTQKRHGLSNYHLAYHDAIPPEMLTILDDETLNLSRVGIMFGLHSYLKESLRPQQGVAENVINDKATKLLQFLVLAISGTVAGVQEFMATSPVPICEALLSAGANPNADWAGRDGGTLWTHLLFSCATRVKGSWGLFHIPTMETFMRNGADLTACVDFQGTRYTPMGLVRFLLQNCPKFADQLVKLLELFEAHTTKLPQNAIAISAPVEQVCAPQLADGSTTASSSVANALQVEIPPSDSCGSRTSLSSSRPVTSQSVSKDGGKRVSRRRRLLRKVLRS